MSIIKYLAIITLSSTVLTGCMPESSVQTDKRKQELGPWLVQNSAQAFGGKVGNTEVRGIFYSTTQPTGMQPSPSGYWLRSNYVDYYAPIQSITLNGTSVDSLSTWQGWLTATSDAGNGVVAGTFELHFNIGAPVNRTIRVSGTDGDSDASYGRYITEVSGGDDGGDWSPFCPHDYVEDDGTHVNRTEYMIPVGGAIWQANGSRTDHANSIQLSCTHDSIGGCVTFGYGPWQVTGNTTMRDTHQACTRMKRADFCGTGDSLATLNQGLYMHTDIEIWDSAGVHDQVHTTATMEALFDTNGATCFNRSKYRSRDRNYIAHMEQLIASPGCRPLPACSKGSTGLVGSARPCQIFDDSGFCVEN